MAWLLDTNQWIFLLKGRCSALAARLASANPSQVWFCSVVKEELLHGALKYGDPAARQAKLEALFAKHESAPFDDEAAAEAARIRHELETAGQKIGPHDTQIAALAMSRGWTLVTSNKDEFARVKGLKLEDWTK